MSTWEVIGAELRALRPDIYAELVPQLAAIVEAERRLRAVVTDPNASPLGRALDASLGKPAPAAPLRAIPAPPRTRESG